MHLYEKHKIFNLGGIFMRRVCFYFLKEGRVTEISQDDIVSVEKKDSRSYYINCSIQQGKETKVGEYYRRTVSKERGDVSNFGTIWLPYRDRNEAIEIFKEDIYRKYEQAKRNFSAAQKLKNYFDSNN